MPSKLLTGILSSNYVLILAEKAKAASKIAYALSNGKARILRYKKIPYWTFSRDGKQYIVAPAAGHLFGLKSLDRGFPTFNYEWKPLWLIDKRSSHLKKYYELLKDLCSKASLFINACDYDIEGSVIGYMIIRFLGDPKRSGRMKFSSLTPEELRDSFKNFSKSLDWEMVEAGICRHELDWIWGINTSRALMYAVYKGVGRRVILSAGRVQSPTLTNIVEREVERESYIPKISFNLKVQVEINGEKYKLEYLGKPFKNLSEAREALKRVKKIGYAVLEDVVKSKELKKPPPPFNLGDLQAEAYRVYKISPYEAQKVAEELYLEALISYPRTNSQELPPTLDYARILYKIREQPEYSDLVEMLFFETEEKLTPRQGSKKDPAHPAIYPTGLKPKGLTGRKREIYDLIVRRFLACFSSNLIIDKTTLNFKVGNLKFRLQPVTVEDYGWLKYYPFYKVREESTPKISPGDTVEIVKADLAKTFSSPPKRYSKSDVIKWMENVNVGTEATRARIVETLFSRGYLKSVKGKIVTTDLGLSISKILREYFSDLTSVELTRRFEKYIEEVRSGRKSREVVIREARTYVLRVLEGFKIYAEKVGLKVAKSLGLIEPEKTCKLCKREVEDLELCTYHRIAYQNLLRNYHSWLEALGRLDFNTYLKEIVNNRNVGSWVKEVARSMLEGKLKAEVQTYPP